MHFCISCTAALELPHCDRMPYIHFNDEASLQELNRNYEGDTHVALAHPHDPGFPGLSAQCQRIGPAQRSRTGRHRSGSLGYSARRTRGLQRIITVQLNNLRPTPALCGRCRVKVVFRAFTHSTAVEKALTLRDDWHQITF